MNRRAFLAALAGAPLAAAVPIQAPAQSVSDGLVTHGLGYRSPITVTVRGGAGFWGVAEQIDRWTRDQLPALVREVARGPRA